MKKFTPFIVGLIYVPFGFLLAWIGMFGIYYTLASCIIAFLVGNITTHIARGFFVSSGRKVGISRPEVETILLQNALYIVPLVIIAYVARIGFGWNTLMPFAATGTMTYIAASTSDMSKAGMKGIFASMAPSLLASGLTMAWTIGFTLLF